ncbi:WXG100 family type VII secretion target [Saccharopolyspora antimicrobica]|uniref:ESAT-6-like protein n=1 Tax=Saccharopolyspora antimicrobica TaxID=455193 RepID=A0A1I5B299_9PSEU|nr:WXG100 family type VII secretion target [Saccharopolyspora antimicrobica]RKT86444.1 WXG100 family type VII secretion target [Saccharopolyspora antimicrobica]SFN68815.1 WXG100 family type VII secretion target [Saccharopolyspora antimicrobica]
MANMPNVQTSQPGMQQAAQIFSDRATEFTQELQRVNTMMASLQGSWTGTASTNFNTAMDNWERSFQTIINKLINMMDVMGVNTKDYVSAEDNAASAAQSFSSALPGV